VSSTCRTKDHVFSLILQRLLKLERMRHITRTVWILSIVSLLTDTASEMLYPVMPVYLKTIGFSFVLIGILEGIAEAAAGLSKGYFGKLSDLSGKRLPFVRTGYALSAISKPLIAAMVFPVWIFFARTMDRLGKGIRTGARDAMLSQESGIESKGKVFGFHRSMDTLGAVAGPVLALLYLYYHPADYRTLFFLALAPGVLAIMATYLLKEKKPGFRPGRKHATSFLSFLKYWKASPEAYRKVVAGMLFFTLFNSSDVFLLLKVKQAGLDDTAVIGVYIFYNLVYALTALPLGMLADRMGLRTVFSGGLVLFSIVYLGMAFTSELKIFLVLFFLYGLYAAATEGISKAWISNISSSKDTATAIGTLTAFQSIMTMLASSLTGLIWYQYGATAAFVLSAAMSLATAVYFMVLNPSLGLQ